MKKQLWKITLSISGILILLEIYRWYQWPVGFSKMTSWEFLTNKGNTGLLWNLFLGWIAVGFGFLIKNSSSIFLAKILFVVWIIWLPNTLYMITDLKYFRADKVVGLWQEVLFFALYSIFGILLYWLSIYLVSQQFKLNRKRIIGITILSIIGVIIGRILRWNSWDVFLNPQILLETLLGLFS